MSCLADDDVQALAFGTLSADLAAPLLAHVGECDACRTLVAALTRARPIDDELRIEPEAPVATIDRYVVQGELGRGGMGVVYVAFDPQLERRIALKLVRGDPARSPELRQRLVREAQVMARVTDPNVLAVYDAGIVDDQVFIAMELAEGGTLARWLAATRRPWRDIVARFVAAGRGLAAAHALGIVHRDFKPDNVLVGGDGRIRVADFGLAISGAQSPRLAADTTTARDARMTAAGKLVGTPAYMAPEQLRGHPVDARSDQFSFAVALHEALTGRRPDQASGPGVRLPRRIRRTIARALALAPDDRFPGMTALIAELERATAGRRHVAVLGLGAIAAVAFTLIAVGAAGRRPPPVRVRSIERLTYAPGCEEYPSFAAGGIVVFDGDAGGVQQLFTLDPATRATRRLTTGPGSQRAALVSPDGRRIAYERQDAGPRELRLVAIDGTGDRSLGPGSTMGGSWLDDHRLVVIGSSGALLLLDVDRAGATPQPFTTDSAHHRFGLTAAFSDGTLAGGWWDPPNNVAVGLVTPTGVRPLAEHMPYVDGALGVAPSGDAIYLVRRAGAANELVRMPRDGGAPEVVSGGIAPARGIAIEPDRLVFSTCAAFAQLVRIDETDEVTPMFRRQPWNDTAPTPLDATRLMFASDRSGHDQLYIADGDATPRPLVTGDVEEGSPSRDGTWIVYSAHDPGGLWIAPSDGSAPAHRITDGRRDDSPVFARDTATVYFLRDDTIYAVARDGGTPRIVAAHGAEPTPAPRDDRVYFLRRPAPGGRAQIFVVAPDGTVAPLPVELPAGNYWSLTISPDGTTLAMVHEGYEVIEVPLAGGPARLRVRLTRWMSSLHYAFVGRALDASLESKDGDLWIADGNFR